VIFQDGAYSNEWTLGDQRNTTATADTTGQITDLVDYADFGAADHESTGWASLVGNDGQPGDPTLGLDHYYARDYDTTTGSWVQPDHWAGLLERPQSLNRYAYIENTPVSFSDHLGYVIKAMPMVDGGRSPAKQVRSNAFTKAATHSMGTSVRSSAGYKAVAKSNGVISKANIKTPTTRSDQFVSVVHDIRARPGDCPPGSTYVKGTYVDQCMSNETLERERQKERDFWNGIAGAWETFSVSASVCLFVCVELGLGGGITVGVGAGPKGGADLSIGTGGAPDGWAVKGQCSVAAGAGVYGEGALASGNPYWGGGLVVGGGVGCAGMIQYRFL
jgi:RHS repeat-associated protein